MKNSDDDFQLQLDLASVRRSDLFETASDIENGETMQLILTKITHFTNCKQLYQWKSIGIPGPYTTSFIWWSKVIGGSREHGRPTVLHSRGVWGACSPRNFQ